MSFYFAQTNLCLIPKINYSCTLLIPQSVQSVLLLLKKITPLLFLFSTIWAKPLSLRWYHYSYTFKMEPFDCTIASITANHFRYFIIRTSKTTNIEQLLINEKIYVQINNIKTYYNTTGNEPEALEQNHKPILKQSHQTWR